MTLTYFGEQRQRLFTPSLAAAESAVMYVFWAVVQREQHLISRPGIGALHCYDSINIQAFAAWIFFLVGWTV